MTEVERLSAWMDERGLSIRQFADKLDMSYDGVYQALVVRKRVGASFKWRFAQVFGWPEAERVFAASSVALPQPS